MAGTASTARSSSSNSCSRNNGAVPLMFLPLVNVVVVAALLLVSHSSFSSFIFVDGFVVGPHAAERTTAINVDADHIFRLQRSLPTGASNRQTTRRIGNRYYHHAIPATSPGNSEIVDTVDDDLSKESSTSFSAAVSLDPASEAAATLLCDQLGLTDTQFGLILELTASVCEWNTKINLVSRRDCRPDTVLGRHILPCLATSRSTALSRLFQTTQATGEPRRVRVLDVGTGGGFPGLPLSIQYADSATFVLADSVGKKIAAVQDMAEQLQLSSSHVETYHGRVEDYFASTTTSGGIGSSSSMDRFDVVTGRSVTALPQFCAWVQHLLQPDTGHLVYWTGGTVDPTLLEQTVHNVALQELMPHDWQDDYDKRILVLTAASVRKIARESGIVVLPTRPARFSKNSNNNNNQPSKRRVKGAWKKRSADEPRQRGYENFKRFSSFSSSSSSTSSATTNDGE